MPSRASSALASRDGELAEMEDARGEHRIGTADADAVGQVLERADPARGDHRHRHRVGDRPRQLEVEAALRAVAVHAGEQDLAGALGRHAARPLRPRRGRCCGGRRGCRRPIRARTAPWRAWRRWRRRCTARRTWPTPRGSLRVGHRGRVEADLVGAGVEQAPHVATLRTPPPTVSGMKTWEATASMMCRIRSRSSLVAVMSRKVSSSAPCSL